MKRLIASLTCLIAAPVLAQEGKPTKPDSAVKLAGVKITAEAAPDRVTPVQALTLPAIASITARKAEETVNLIDTEDAVKYLPSVFRRKRNNGDTQATMGTRVWGVSSSAE